MTTIAMCAPVPSLCYPEDQVGVKRPLHALQVRFRTRPSMRSQFAYPGRDVRFEYYDGQTLVGTASGVFAPTGLYDRFYVYGFSTSSALRMKGYATSMLVDIARRSNAPLTPVHVGPQARLFWEHMREVLPRYGVTMTARIDEDGLLEETRRWNSPEAESAFLDTQETLARMSLAAQ